MSEPSLRVRRSLLISGYIRISKFESVINNIIPKEINILIEEFYPICIDFTGSKLGLTVNEKESITKYLLKTLITDQEKQSLSATLLHSAPGNEDRLTAESWHNKCDHNRNTLTIVETEYDHIFGCFATVAFDQNLCGRQMDRKSFLCLIRTQFVNAECPKLCPYTTGYAEYGPYSGNSYGPCFGHSFDVGIFAWKDDKHYVNHSKYTNYPDAVGNELCGGTQMDLDNVDKEISDRSYKSIHFNIKRIETYRIDVS